MLIQCYFSLPSLPHTLTSHLSHTDVLHRTSYLPPRTLQRHVQIRRLLHLQEPGRGPPDTGVAYHLYQHLLLHDWPLQACRELFHLHRATHAGVQCCRVFWLVAVMVGVWVCAIAGLGYLMMVNAQ